MRVGFEDDDAVVLIAFFFFLLLLVMRGFDILLCQNRSASLSQLGQSHDSAEPHTASQSRRDAAVLHPCQSTSNTSCYYIVPSIVLSHRFECALSRSKHRDDRRRPKRMTKHILCCVSQRGHCRLFLFDVWPA